LELCYPSVFKATKVLISKSPFTSFAFTKHYNYRHHLDENNYDLEFIIWCKRGYFFLFLIYEEDEDNDYLFVFPKLKASFNTKHDNVLCFRARDLLHYTRDFKKTNLFDLIFFQKASLLK